MNIRLSKVGAIGLGLALVAGAGSIAYAADDDLYTGGNASAVDPDDTKTLTIVDASGTEITSGSISDPLGAFAVASDTVRSGDTAASLFVHLPASDTAPAAWSGLQTSSTTTFSGSGAATAPAGVTDKPFVSLADSLPLDQAIETYPNTETDADFKGVYQLRLRTSSSTNGVSNQYASESIKVTGDTWTVVGAEAAPEATITPTWGAGFAYGSTRNVAVTVKGGEDAASGSVKLVSGTTTVSAAPKTLDAAGKATLTIAKGKLFPGTRKVKVVFTSDDTDIAQSSSTADHSYLIAKGTAAAPTFKVTKKITAKAAGTIVVTQATPSGLQRPAGKVTIVISKGSKKTTITKTLSAGKATVSVPKRAAGKWKITVKYLGSAVYNARAAAAKTYTVAKK